MTHVDRGFLVLEDLNDVQDVLFDFFNVLRIDVSGYFLGDLQEKGD